MDEAGFGLALPPTCTWTKRGRKHCLKVPTRWGKAGRINVIGSLCLHQEEQTLFCRLLDGSCHTAAVIAYLNTLADRCTPETLTVVVLDNATFHKSKQLRKKQAVWEQQGLFLRFLPPYCPFLNLVETVWKRLKAFLLPRRYYDSKADLTYALLSALNLFGAVLV